MSAQDNEPLLSRAESLTANFYSWEKPLRGWTVAEYPVLLEPAFQPFFHKAPVACSGLDDGRIDGLWARVVRLVARSPGRTAAPPEEPPFDLCPVEDTSSDEIVELRVECPESFDMSPELAAQLLLSLGSATSPVSFELVGSDGKSQLQLAVRTEDEAAVRQVILAHAPNVVLHDWGGPLVEHWNLGEERSRVVVDFGLSHECMLPLRRQRTFAVDPLSAFIGTLQSLAPSEFGMLQVLFVRTAWPWAESMLRAVSDDAGRAFFADAPDLRGQTLEKVDRPLFACVVRACASAPTAARAWQIVRGIGNGLSVLSDPASNDLIALTNEDYPDEWHAENVIFRQSRRTGMLLSVDELAGLVHLPAASVHAPGLRPPKRATKAASAVADQGDVLVGENTHRGETKSIRLSRKLRLRHTYVIGATGTGKSTLLRSLILQDIDAGRGVVLLDPHGDLVEDVLAGIPEERHGDVVLFDPADEERPVGLNVLQARTDRERELLSSDLVSVFQRLSTSWGDQMTAVLGNAVLAILDHPARGTLLDLRRLLAEKSFRDEYLQGVRDPVVRSFFKQDFPRLIGRPQTPILTRLDAFLRPRMVRGVVCQREAKLDLGQTIDQGKIFLGKLSQGAIGAENAALLGSLILSKVHQAAIARERMPEEARKDAFLYIDEFQEFRTPSLSSLLSGGRKFHVGLVLAHQNRRQLSSDELADSILANAATRVCFRLGDDDARVLARGFSGFDAQDLQNLGVGEAICRIERSDQDFNLRVAAPPRVDDATGHHRRAAIRADSRWTNGTSRLEVEAEIAAAFGEHESVQPSEPTPSVAVAAIHPTADPAVARTSAPVRRVTRRSAASTHPEATESLGGRGGPQHRYLQSLIKRYVEDRGFRAILEAPAEGGGRIDVLLSRAGVSIACEISIASTPAQEIENLEKCRRCNVQRVALISPVRKTLRAVAKLAEPLIAESPTPPVDFCTPDEFLALIDGLVAATETREETVLGYRVKTTVRPPDVGDASRRTEAITRTVVSALKRLRGKDGV